MIYIATAINKRQHQLHWHENKLVFMLHKHNIVFSGYTIVPSWEFPNAELFDQIHLIWILKVELCWYMPSVSCIRFGNQSSAGICDFGRGLRLWDLLTDINPVLACIVWYICGICSALLNHASKYVEKYRDWSPIGKVAKTQSCNCYQDRVEANILLIWVCFQLALESFMCPLNSNGIVEVSPDPIQSNSTQKGFLVWIALEGHAWGSFW